MNWRTVLVLFALGIVALVLWNAPAWPHDWYPRHCCSGQDCSMVADEDVKMAAGGWFIPATGELISFQDDKVGVSPDGKFHRCVFPNGLTRCLFVPGQGA